MLLFIFSFSDLDGKYELPLLKFFQLLLQMSVLLDYMEEKKILLSGKQFVDQVDNRSQAAIISYGGGALAGYSSEGNSSIQERGENGKLISKDRQLRNWSFPTNKQQQQQPKSFNMKLWSVCLSTPNILIQISKDLECLFFPQCFKADCKISSLGQ